MLSLFSISFLIFSKILKSPIYYDSVIHLHKALVYYVQNLRFCCFTNIRIPCGFAPARGTMLPGFFILTAGIPRSSAPEFFILKDKTLPDYVPAVLWKNNVLLFPHLLEQNKNNLYLLN